MATSSKFRGPAKRGGMSGGSLARHNTCSCHPQQWGAKKGARRLRRRISKQIIREELGGKVK